MTETIFEKNCILWPFSRVPSTYMEEAGFLNYSGASPQGAIEMLWPHFCGAIFIFSLYICHFSKQTLLFHFSVCSSQEIILNRPLRSRLPRSNHGDDSSNHLFPECFYSVATSSVPVHLQKRRWNETKPNMGEHLLLNRVDSVMQFDHLYYTWRFSGTSICSSLGCNPGHLQPSPII